MRWCKKSVRHIVPHLGWLLVFLLRKAFSSVYAILFLFLIIKVEGEVLELTVVVLDVDVDKLAVSGA